MALTTQNLTSPRTGIVWDVLAGLWLIVAPFILGYSNVASATWNDIIVGIIVLGASWAGAYGATRDRDANRMSASQGINILAGIWLFFAPFILGYSDVANALWNDMILGVLIIVFAGLTAARANKNRSGSM